ncbi:hypothetical protein XELAEV_18045551mg [Xenopus laevis]|uniref:Uncharacterized protein n=1 Tax=Xenopus laevis TaxID=8355 RepID=A0A974C155_XENLA|nr:hypothetical protein XELAEV_18045551mg [Xenopus laevis]
MNFSRYPVEATGISMVQNGKIRTYMLSILWSDRNNILIYRTYEEFKDLAKQLKRNFPLESGLLNKSERIIPILQDIPLIYRSFSNRFIERLHMVQIYSEELLQTDSKISQSEDVIRFFSPTSEDLAPTFVDNRCRPKNRKMYDRSNPSNRTIISKDWSGFPKIVRSARRIFASMGSFRQDQGRVSPGAAEASLVIMPSDKDQVHKKINHRMQSSAPVSEPVISQKYICIETFETKDTKNRPFKVSKDELIDVVIKDPTGWWLVENEDKSLAWFPGPYLVQPEDAAYKCSGTKSSDGKSYYAVKGYQAHNSDELSLGVGVVVEVTEKTDNGWWRVCWYIVRKKESSGELCNTKRPGRPRKTTVVDDRRIFSMVKRNPFTTAKQVNNTLQEVFYRLDWPGGNPRNQWKSPKLLIFCLFLSYNGRCGYVPSMFLKPYCNPHQQLQVTFAHSRFGSAPNLHKDPSCLGGIHDPGTEDRQSGSENGNSDMSVSWRRSRSMGEFKDFQEFHGDVLETRSFIEGFAAWQVPQHDDYPLPTTESNNSEKITIIISPDDDERANQSQTDSTQSSLRKDSGLDQTHSATGFYVSRFSPDTMSNTRPPMVPPRPTRQEILTRCTTITKTASQI